MPQKLKTIDEVIETALKEWSAQGRTKEQIYGATNFMTGRGLRMVEELLDGLVMKKNKSKKLMSVSVESRRIGYNICRQEVLDRIKALKAGDEER